MAAKTSKILTGKVSPAVVKHTVSLLSAGVYMLLFGLQKTHCQGIVVTFRTPSLLLLQSNCTNTDKAEADC